MRQNHKNQKPKISIDALEKTDSGAFSKDRFFDMHFPELLADPMGVVEAGR